MLMIIMYHVFFHCIVIQLTDVNSIATFNNGWYSYPTFSKELSILAVISPMGQIGNAIFLIISGYFMVNKKNIDLTKISKKLLLQLVFSSIVLGLFSIYAYKNFNMFPIDLVSFSAVNTMCWYIGYYFIVIVIAKILLNYYLNEFSQKNYAMFLMTLFAIVQFSWSASILSNIAAGLETVCTGIFLYSLGGYIKKYNPFASFRLWTVISIIIIINLVVIGDFYISTANKILDFNPNGSEMFIQSIPEYGNNNFVPVILGIAIFELFRRIRISNNRIINFVGVSTFMIYLIHDNVIFYKIWNMWDWITLLHTNVIDFLLTLVVVVFFTFIIGLVVYFLFEMCGKLFNVCRPCIIRVNGKKDINNH